MNEIFKCGMVTEKDNSNRFVKSCKHRFLGDCFKRLLCPCQLKPLTLKVDRSE